MVHGGQCDRKVNIDFSVNLNPQGTPDTVKAAILEGIERMGQYPDYEQTILRTKLAKLEGIETDQVIAGNGASELIMAVVRAVNPKKAVIVEPAFYGYRHALEALGNCEIVDFVLAGDDVDFKEVNIILNDSDLLFLANPGNPIGQNIDEKSLENVLDAAKERNCAVVLDESFFLMSQGYCEVDINRTSRLLEQYSNLYILRSFTKLMAIPGIRIGYIMSTQERISKIKRQLCEWNISQPADYAGRACADIIGETEIVKNGIDYVNQERAYLISKLKERGYLVYKSNTVYITFKGGEYLFNEMLDKGILLRDCSSFKGLRKGYYRIAVKDHQSNKRLIEALDEIRGDR